MTKIQKFVALTVLTLTAGVALAVQQIDLSLSPRLQGIINGILIAPRSLITTDAVINTHRITRALGGSITFDFASATILCEDSTAIAILGARTGDPCFVGIPSTLSSTGTGRDASYTCYVSAADAVKVRHCPAGTADNPASVLYYVRVLSSAAN